MADLEEPDVPDAAALVPVRRAEEPGTRGIDGAAFPRREAIRWEDPPVVRWGSLPPSLAVPRALRTMPPASHRGVEKWYLTRLITWGSRVRIPPPPPDDK